MPPINLLIKPASSACNMHCRYCFYNAIAEQRETAFLGVMSDALLEQVIEAAFAYAEHYCGFAFQGGEPTLAGLPFFERAVELQTKHNKKNIRVSNAIQTNGYAVDDTWAAFFKNNSFLVGLSLDGSADTHNLNRVDRAGEPTFNRVMRAASALSKHGVSFNILSVVTGKNARNIEKTYNFFKKSGFLYLQFIPCMEPLNCERGCMPYHLGTNEYAPFLIRVFDLWYRDFQKGQYVSIRHIDNLVSIVCGREPEACNMRGRCTLQFVVEGDGSVYPCDFFVYDNWRLGNIREESLADMAQSERAQRFLAASQALPFECRECCFLHLCRNGCARERENGQNYYCSSYKEYFNHLLSNGHLDALRIMR